MNINTEDRGITAMPPNTEAQNRRGEGEEASRCIYGEHKEHCSIDGEAINKPRKSKQTDNTYDSGSEVLEIHRVKSGGFGLILGPFFYNCP